MSTPLGGGGGGREAEYLKVGAPSAFGWICRTQRQHTFASFFLLHPHSFGPSIVFLRNSPSFPLCIICQPPLGIGTSSPPSPSLNMFHPPNKFLEFPLRLPLIPVRQFTLLPIFLTFCPFQLISHSFIFICRISFAFSSMMATAFVHRYHQNHHFLNFCCFRTSSSPSLLLLLLFISTFMMPSGCSAYFVLTRYSVLPRYQQQQHHQRDLALPPNWATEFEAQSLDELAQELSLEQWMRPPFDDATNHPILSDAKKRSAGAAKLLTGHEHVCKTLIRTDFRPTHGHEQNGTRVEIQQDERRQFSATFVECENTKREHCHGIDNAMFSSECMTVYEFRLAGVRLEGSADDFVDGHIKVPITCQCRLRRKIGNGILPNL